jgi:hypothetical protein
MVCDCAVRDGPQDLRIQTREAGKLLRIGVIALPVTMRDRPQLPHVGHDDFVSQLRQLLADPDRAVSRLRKLVVLIYMFRSRRIEGECVVGRGLRDTTGDLVAEVSRRIQQPKK